jgi:hypothetical protein
MNMSLGAGIFLFVIGAILRFALNVSLGWIDLALVGNILMIAGIVVVILGIVLLMRKRRSSVTTRVDADPTTGQAYNRTERSDDLDV